MLGDELRGQVFQRVSNSPARRLRQDSNKKLRASSRDGLNSTYSSLSLYSHRSRMIHMPHFGLRAWQT